MPRPFPHDKDQAGSGSSGNDWIVLVVEDEFIHRTMLVQTIMQTGCVVWEAEDGNSALDLISKQLPDLILLDVLMPGLDGFELCRILKARPETGNIPIIFISALDEVEDEIKGLEVGAVDYIYKPINSAIVKARVLTHLDLKYHRDRLEEMVVERTAALQDALDKIKTLKGLLPICAACKKIRDDRGYWNKIEVFIENHSEAEFTHGICPDCAKRLNPDLYEDI